MPKHNEIPDHLTANTEPRKPGDRGVGTVITVTYDGKYLGTITRTDNPHGAYHVTNGKASDDVASEAAARQWLEERRDGTSITPS